MLQQLKFFKTPVIANRIVNLAIEKADAVQTHGKRLTTIDSLSKQFFRHDGLKSLRLFDVHLKKRDPIKPSKPNKSEKFIQQVALIYLGLKFKSENGTHSIDKIFNNMGLSISVNNEAVAKELILNQKGGGKKFRKKWLALFNEDFELMYSQSKANKPLNEWVFDYLYEQSIDDQHVIEDIEEQINNTAIELDEDEEIPKKVVKKGVNFAVKQIDGKNNQDTITKMKQEMSLTESVVDEVDEIIQSHTK